MKGLRKYLTPFAPDQSGAASVLYDLGGILVICDAGGCAGNICGFDEPRWSTQRSAVFSAGLRDMDAILGRDDRLIQKLTDVSRRIDANFAAVIGPDRKERHTDKAALVRRALRVLGGDQRTEGDHPDDYPGAGVKTAEHGAAAGAEDTIAEHALMVGDREYDAVGAAREGVDTIGVLYGYGSPEELRDAGAAYLARTPEEAAAIACGRDELAPGTARIAGTVRHSSVDGPGVRYVVFFQGCPHHCPECQNPETWDPAGGEEVSLEDLTEDLRATRYLDGVTLSGGDPFLQPEAAMAVADAGREMGLNVWAYTGWTFEALLDGAAGQKARELLGHLDVVVDGPFRRELLSKECLFRGSSNQRLIDVPASLAAGKAVEARL